MQKPGDTVMGSMPATGVRFMRPQPSPALAPQPGTLAGDSATTPDFLAMGADLYCYVGAVSGGHERILALKVDPAAFDPPIALNATPAALAVDIGPPGRFDSEHVMDPASAAVGGRVFLYYSGLGAGPDSIGLATSGDGLGFIQHPERILCGRAPEVVVHEGRFFLFYVLETSQGGYAIHLARSADGIHFEESEAGPVLGPGEPGAWDAFSVTTPRVFAHGGFFYMVYAGDDETRDLPKAFGLARSRDLAHWTRYPHNPVFRRGHAGAWDDGAIWFGTVFEWKNYLYLFYEGAGRAALAGGMARSAVGVALCPVEEFDRRVADWSEE